jgi:hypothetical protein
MKKGMGIAVGVCASALGIGLATAGTASASSAAHPAYEVAFSQSCDNASLCYGGPGALGGSWGWAVLNTNGTGDLQITLCGHGGGQAGAQHFSVDIYQWSIDSANGVFYINSSDNPMFNGDSPIPAAPGHYSQHPAPGVSMEIQVTAVSAS